jgi:hypothetical protein
MKLKWNLRPYICAALRAVGECSQKCLHYGNTCISMVKSNIYVITMDVARYLFCWSGVSLEKIDHLF